MVIGNMMLSAEILLEPLFNHTYDYVDHVLVDSWNASDHMYVVAATRMRISNIRKFRQLMQERY